MSFYDGKGNLIALSGDTASAGYSITPKNLFDPNSELHIHGWYYGFSGGWKWIEDAEYMTAITKLTAGTTYYIASTSSDYRVYTESATMGADKPAFNGDNIPMSTLYTEGKGAFTPTQDCYLHFAYKIGTAKHIVTTDPYVFPETTKAPPSTGWFTTENVFSGGRDVGLLWSEDIGQETDTSQSFEDGTQVAQNIDDAFTDSDFVMGVFGDSIVYGASNVGLPNTYHVRLIDKFNVQYWWRTTAGTTATYGYGMEWQSGNTKYGTGFTGFKAFMEAYGSERALKVYFSKLKIALLAIGTNDFGNSAPLGTYGNGDTSTFYGGYQAYIDLIRSYNPNLPIILVIPFKRSNWNEANAQGYTLPEYNYVIYDIAQRYKGVYVLDVFDCWWGNYDNTNIAQGGKSSMFLDGVHPNERFHRIMAVKLEEKVKEVIQQEGIILHKIP